MKYSKSKNFSEWYSEIIQETEMADLRYNIKGFIVNRWLAVKAMKLMYALYEAELERTRHRPVWFPALIPGKNFEIEAEHAKGFAPEVWWVSGAGSKKKKLEEDYALRPTSETAMLMMFKEWIRSWRDLPLKRYQQCQVWRYETKATRPFLRGREFHWIEAHDAFATQREAENQVLEDMRMTENIMHKEFGIPSIFFRRPEWDKFPGAVYTYAADSIFPNSKIIQQPSTHYFGTKFSKAFDVKYMDKMEKEQYAHTTAYGPCIWRILASVISLHGDDNGLVFPPKIAPVQVVIVPILFAGKEKKVVEKSKALKKKLETEGYRVELDLSDKTAGNKFYHWELRGVPIRIEIGPKDVASRSVILARRDTKAKRKVRDRDFLKAIESTNKSILLTLRKRADQFMAKNIRSAKKYSDLKKILKEKGGFVKVNFCSIDFAGDSCADKIQKDTAGDVRGCRVDKKERVTGPCIVCGRKATKVVYVAKSY